VIGTVIDQSPLILAPTCIQKWNLPSQNKLVNDMTALPNKKKMLISDVRSLTDLICFPSSLVLWNVLPGRVRHTCARTPITGPPHQCGASGQLVFF
jgi:hypothetical protein